MFSDVGSYDFTLLAGSPCIDAGDPDPIYNDSDASRCDIGAYPFAHATSVADSDNLLPSDFSLSQNYPNPFNPNMVIQYALPSHSEVELTIYNLLGQKVITLVNQEQLAGVHQARWNGTNASGVYLYKLTAGDFVETRKVMLVK